MECPPILVYRFGHCLHRLGLRRIAYGVSWINRFLFATWIPSSAEIGKNFLAGYWGLGIVIHSNVRIGDNCWISQNVTIGRRGSDKGVPVIGNNVHIGAGSVVIGEIEIGDYSIVGSNSLVNRSIPPHSLAFGTPARVVRDIRHEYREEIDYGGME